MRVTSPRPKDYELCFESAPMIAKALERAKTRGDNPETYEPDPDEIYDYLEVDSEAAGEREVARLRKDGIATGYISLMKRENIRDEGFEEDGHYFESWEYDEGDIVRDDDF